jgi:hypothetical protein
MSVLVYTSFILRGTIHLNPEGIELSLPLNPIFCKSAEDILDFIQDRFENTLFEEEYYLCMLYLTKSIEKEALYVPFKQSPQYLRMISGSSEGDYIAQNKNVLIPSRHIVKSYQKFTIRR